MTDLIVTQPGDEEPKISDDASESSQQKKKPSGYRRSSKVPDVETCLAALAELVGAIAMGFIQPAKANAMRANYAEILRHHDKTESRNAHQGIADVDVMELMRKDPTIFSIMEPFLTDEQIDMVMKNAKDGDDGQT